MFDIVPKKKVHIAIFIVWLFHISALIGINLGHVTWFIEKTPLNLNLCLFLFILSYPIREKRQLIAFVIFFSGGMFFEWLGVSYGLLFGTYEYGANFGFKIDGVPFLIGTYWALLTFITASILDYSRFNTGLKIILSATLMLVLDFFMEHSAPTFDFWTFETGMAPLQNYIAWFSIGLLFQIVLRLLKIQGNKIFSLHLYLAQLLFFMVFYFKEATY